MTVPGAYAGNRWVAGAASKRTVEAVEEGQWAVRPGGHGERMPMTTLRRDGACASCRTALPSGSRAFYEPATGQVTCPGHHPDPRPAPAFPPVLAAATAPEPSDQENPLVWWAHQEASATGTPQRHDSASGGSTSTGRGRWRRRRAPAGQGGGSAREFADHTAAAYRESVRSAWGPLAPLVLLARPDDASVRAARKGAAGEEKLASYLDRVARRSGGRVVVMHDRTIPGRRENIDHLVVAPTGVWAVDSKAYAGLLSTGGRWARTRALTMGGRDGDRLIGQSIRQQRFVTQSYGRVGLPVLPTHGALCFLDANWGPGADGSRVQDVWVLSPRRLRRQLLAEGPLNAAQVAHAALVLGTVFTPARWDT